MSAPDPMRETLDRIAALAHCGGAAGLDERAALTLIRRLTLPYFVRTDSLDEMHERVRKALRAGSKP